MRIIGGFALHYLAIVLFMTALQQAWPYIWDRILIVAIVGALFLGGSALFGSRGAR